MWFDAKAALRKLELQPSPPAIPAIPASQTPQIAEIAKIAGHPVQNTENPDLHAFEERAAIAEYDGGLSRADAEQLAARCQGYENVVAFKAAKMKTQKGSDND